MYLEDLDVSISESSFGGDEGFGGDGDVGLVAVAISKVCVRGKIVPTDLFPPWRLLVLLLLLLTLLLYCCCCSPRQCCLG